MLANSRPLLTSPTFQPDTNTLSGLQGSYPADPLPLLPSSWPSPPLTLLGHPSGVGLREWCPPDWSLHLPLHPTFLPPNQDPQPGFHACSEITICHPATPHISVVLPPIQPAILLAMWTSWGWARWHRAWHKVGPQGTLSRHHSNYQGCGNQWPVPIHSEDRGSLIS